VQITLTGNKISTTGGNQLVADLTGDGVVDVGTWGAFASAGGVSVFLGGWVAARYRSSDGLFFVDAEIEAVQGGDRWAVGGDLTSASYLNRVTFTDTRINGGAATNGWLQVNAFNTSTTNHTVELARLIFDDASTTRPALVSVPGVLTEWNAVSAVPEASTSLGLLALGAGGLLTRRRLKRAA
jgi:hypothetical protein